MTIRQLAHLGKVPLQYLIRLGEMRESMNAAYTQLASTPAPYQTPRERAFIKEAGQLVALLNHVEDLIQKPTRSRNWYK